MNELTKNIHKMMIPKAAIIAYKYEDRRNFDTRYFIELRPIGKSGQMGAGIPVTHEFMNTLLESYTEEMSGIPQAESPKTCWPAIRGKARKNMSGTIRPERDRCSFTRNSISRTACSICRELSTIKKRKHGRIRLQGKTSGGDDSAVPCPVLQRDRIKCLPWQQFFGKATEPDFPFPAGILGKTVLAD